MHPKERELLVDASTLEVTVESPEQFADEVATGIEALSRGEDGDGTPRLSFTSYDRLLETLTPRVLELVETIRRERPGSINEAARIVDRDVKNVHEELTRLENLGIIYFESEGQAKRPVVWFEELVINLPFDREHGRDAAPA